jgi:hypothetical protein
MVVILKWYKHLLFISLAICGCLPEDAQRVLFGSVPIQMQIAGLI